VRFSSEQHGFAVEVLPRASRLPAGFEDVDLAILDWIAAHRRGGAPTERPAMPPDFTPHFDIDKAPIH
jgi:hypothetical protein